jgi:hypothetical protein
VREEMIFVITESVPMFLYWIFQNSQGFLGFLGLVFDFIRKKAFSFKHLECSIEKIQWKKNGKIISDGHKIAVFIDVLQLFHHYNHLIDLQTLNFNSLLLHTL